MQNTLDGPRHAKLTSILCIRNAFEPTPSYRASPLAIHAHAHAFSAKNDRSALQLGGNRSLADRFRDDDRLEIVRTHLREFADWPGARLLLMTEKMADVSLRPVYWNLPERNPGSRCWVIASKASDEGWRLPGSWSSLSKPVGKVRDSFELLPCVRPLVAKVFGRSCRICLKVCLTKKVCNVRLTMQRVMCAHGDGASMMLLKTRARFKLHKRWNFIKAGDTTKDERKKSQLPPPPSVSINWKLSFCLEPRPNVLLVSKLTGAGNRVYSRFAVECVSWPIIRA